MLKILAHLKRYWPMIIGNILAVFCNVLATLMLPNYMSSIVNVGIANGDIPYMLATGVKMVGMAAAGMAAMICASFLSSRIAMGVGRDLRRALFHKVESFSQVEFDRFGTASLITRSTNDITQVENFMMVLMRMVMMAPLMLLGGIFMAYRCSPRMFQVLMVSVPLLVVSVLFIARRALPLSTSVQEMIDRVNLVMREKLTGIRVLRAFGTEDYEEGRFDKANSDLTRTTTAMNRLMSLLFPLLTILLNGTTIMVVWVGARQVGEGILQVGDIMAMAQYVMQIILSVTMMSMMMVMLPRAQVAAGRINRVMETQLTIQEAAAPVTPSGQKGWLEFENVTFRYPNAQSPALEGISFRSGPGEVTAVIGSTGSGKSTLVNLIPRFYDVTEGRILVDGVDIRSMSQKDLRARIGYVPQKNMLFRETIAGNIRYGKEDATDAQVAAAATVAQASEFIESKEDVYGAQVSQGGSNLSGGQKQRLSIARAVVRQPEIYLFDDSFSALDFKTDARVREELAKVTGSATVVMVAQRVSTIMNADRIIVLENGRVAGMGTHEELIQNCGVYREIAVSQLSAEEVGL